MLPATLLSPTWTVPLADGDFTQKVDPVGGSLAASALIAMIPLLVVFVCLGVLKTKAHVAALSGLLASLIIAVFFYAMPANLALLSATEGFIFGVFPIMWIVLCAIWLYQLTVTSGRFEDLRGVFDSISEDPRIQAVLIAFCFGGLLEALAGFGAPVAITATMIMALGMAPLRTAAVVLLANTAPVAFGAIAIPITTAAALTGIPATHIGAIVGRQAPLLACFVPILLLLLADGRRGVREVWPAALVTGLSFAIAQFVTSNYISVELTDIVASLVGLAAAVIFLRFWQPKGSAEARVRLLGETEALQTAGGAGVSSAGRVASRGGASGSTPTATTYERAPLQAGRVWMALFPYLLIIVIFSLSKLVKPFSDFLAKTDIKINWPALNGHIIGTDGKPVTTTIYNFQWLSSPGTLLLICGIIVAIVYKISASAAAKDFVDTVVKLRLAILTVASVLALAYVMNLSGQTIALGTWIAGTGAFFAFLSPILGWFGTAVTGSDTSSNALFAKLQQTAGIKAGIDPALLVSANTTGGVVGKMVSPQNLTIAASSVKLDGQESIILRKMLPWSLGLLLFLCILVYLQSTVFAWMLPPA